MLKFMVLNEMILQLVHKTTLPAPICMNSSADSIWKLQRFIMRFLPSILLPPTVSWAVQCVLTLAHLPVSPMSNANDRGRQCSANPAIPKLLSHSFTPPRRLHCGREQKSTRMCSNCNCNSNVSHQRCQYSALHNSEQFLYEHKHEAAIMNLSVLRLHRGFIKQSSHWRV